MPVQALPKDRLFLALFPDAAASRHIAQIAQQLRARHAVRGRPLPTDHFHVSLHHLGDFHGLPENIIQAARLAVTKATAGMRSFEVRFDHANSFGSQPNNRPCVLLAHGGNTALHEFRQKLTTAFGSGRSIRAFTPHLTLFYEDRIVAEELVKPVGWMARELVLVHSVVGEGRYEPIARWTLQG